MEREERRNFGALATSPLDPGRCKDREQVTRVYPSSRNYEINQLRRRWRRLYYLGCLTVVVLGPLHAHVEADCGSCPAGQHCQADVCVDCQAGATSMAGSTICSLCPAGKFETNHDECMNCDEGKTSSNGSDSCAQCPAGTFALLQQNGCDECPDGEISSEGSSECYACDSGTYERNHTECVSCDAGKTSPTGNTTCFDCPFGTYELNRTECRNSSSDLDLRGSIKQGREPCFQYFPDKDLFRMTCSVVIWAAYGYDADTCIFLAPNETFEGGEGNVIELGEIDNFRGFIRIIEDGYGIESFDEAPLIRNVHVKNGTTAPGAGFIVRQDQRYFSVETCSSTGNIGERGGGICGRDAGHHEGQVKIANSYSEGIIQGNKAGGIAGFGLGIHGGTANIAQCYSTGPIQGAESGGICGQYAGVDSGLVYMAQSYSLGRIAGEESGGIAGAGSALDFGEVYITNCYSRGDIGGGLAGGITGQDTGGWGSVAGGSVNITNTYASGAVNANQAGGLIGNTGEEALIGIHVQYSVYNGSNGANVVGGGDSSNALHQEGISASLDTIRGALYNDAGTWRWDQHIWALNGSDELVILRFQLHQTPCKHCETPTKAPTPCMTPTETPTPCKTPRKTPTPYMTPTKTPTPSKTPTRTPTTTKTATPSNTARQTSTFSRTATPSSNMVHSTSPATPLLRPGSVIVRSGCGTRLPSNCARAEFLSSESFTLAGNSSSLPGAPTNLTVSVRNGTATAPKIDLTCGPVVGRVPKDAVVYSGCQEDLSGTQFDVPLPMILDIDQRSNNGTCAPHRSNCTRFDYMIHIRLHPHSSQLFSKQAPLIRQQSSGERFRRLAGAGTVVVPLLIPVTVEGEILVAAEKLVMIDVTNEIEPTELETSAEPTMLKIDEGCVAIPGNDSKRVTRAIFLTLKSGYRYSWKLGSRIQEIVNVPPSGNVGEEPVSFKQIITFDLRHAPAGRTTSHIHIVVTDTALDKTDTLVIYVSLRIREADVDIAQPVIRVQRSIEDTAVVREVTMSNSGDFPAKWKARMLSEKNVELLGEDTSVFRLTATDGTTSRRGEIGSSVFEKEVLQLHVLPQNANETGVFVSWILVETNSKNGPVQVFEQDSPPSAPASSSLVGRNLWVKIELVIASVFVCPDPPAKTQLHPQEHLEAKWTVVNVAQHPVVVRPIDFRLKVLPVDNHTTDFADARSKAVNVAESGGKLRVGEWFTLTPPSAVVSSDNRWTFKAVVGFAQPKIRIGDRGLFVKASVNHIRLEYVMSVLTLQQWTSGTSFSSSSDSREAFVEPDFLAGPADARQSIVIFSETRTSLSTPVNVTVKLADKFGNAKAKVMLVSSSGQERFRSTTGDIPTLTVTNPISEDDSSFASVSLEFSQLTNGVITGDFDFHVHLEDEGKALIDVRIDEESIVNSPFAVTAQANCSALEILSEHTGACLCQPGYARARQYDLGAEDKPPCEQCPEGRFQPEPTDDDRCILCAEGFFSPKGSSKCFPCPSTGFECIGGRLRMGNGYWCEICAKDAKLSNGTTRDSMLERVRSGNTPVMHRCAPPTACDVEPTQFRTTCSEGRKGPLCSVCRDGYAKTKTLCLPCQNGQRDKATVAFSALVALAVVIGLNVVHSKKTLTDYEAGETDAERNQNKQKTGLKDLEPNNCANDSEAAESDAEQNRNGKQTDPKDLEHNNCDNATTPGEVIRNDKSVNSPGENKPKIPTKRKMDMVKELQLYLVFALDYMQILALLGSLDATPFAGSIAWFKDFAELSLMSPSQADSFRCISQLSFFGYSLLSLIAPWMLVVVSILLQLGINAFRNSKTGWRESVKKSLQPLHLLLGLVHTAVSTTVVDIFNVYPKEVYGSQRLRASMELKTSSDDYTILETLAGLTLVTVVLGVPFLMIGFLIWSHKHAKSPELHEQFLNNIRGFREHKRGYLWPAIVIIRRTLVLLSVFLVGTAIHQSMLVTGILLSSLWLSTIMQPYKLDTPLNLLESLKSVCCAVTAAFGLVHSFSSRTDERRLLEGATMLIQIVMLLVTGFTFALALVSTYKSMTTQETLEELARKLAPLRDKIQQLLLKCKSKMPTNSPNVEQETPQPNDENESDDKRLQQMNDNPMANHSGDIFQSNPLACGGSLSRNQATLASSQYFYNQKLANNAKARAKERKSIVQEAKKDPRRNLKRRRKTLFE
eukprot:gb/GECG01000632.1/.p1 GENE.gb/GECG01000632.1/~~gb/GECG01000632.1/.p1  ORF type:complete len:2178 (+),score=195.34 gb/GECG01000632.1/:1-6534(+)